MVQFTPDQWIIIALVFVLGILVGLFMLSGRGKKYKTLYREEVARREALEADYKASEAEWRERDSLRGAALRNRGHDVDNDGIDDRLEPGTQRPRDYSPARDRHDIDRDGIDDRVEPGRQHPPGRDPHDVDRDGIDDRIEPGTQRPR